jgi:hypothetical protein
MATVDRRAGLYVAEPDGWGQLVEQLVRLIGRLWCWREFSVPVIAVVVTYETGHPTVALAGGFVVICTVVLLLFARQRIVIDAAGRCNARSERFSRRIAWPQVCRDLGWARRVEKGSWLVPHLISWSENEREVTVRVRPLPEHGPSSWAQMADSLRRLVAGATVQWRESGGTLTVLISRTGLPAKLVWGPGASEAGRIVIGQRHGGAPLALDALRTPHVLVSGATGSGKGGAIRSALAGALESGWQAVVIDPKESGEYRWLDHLGVPVLSNLVEQVEVLREIEAVRQQRQQRIKDCGADSWLHLPEVVRPGWYPLLLVIDEAADLLVPVKGRSQPQREYAGLQQEAGRLIVQLVRKGRSAGIHVIVAIQRPDTAQLGEQGGALRNNLTARLALGSLDAEGIRMLGIPSSDPVATTLDGTPGRGVCVGFGDDPRPSACQVAWIDQHEVLTQVKPLACQGIEEIEPFANATAIDEEDEEDAS